MKPLIGIAALGACNRRSISAALERAGAAIRWIEQPHDVAGCDALVLPGVANFGFVARELDRAELRAPLRAACEAGVPLLGICAGFQLLFESSDEAPESAGLGLLRGRVRRLQTPRVPHIGWNYVEASSDSVGSGWAYFANAYAPGPGSDTIAVTREGDAVFASAGQRGNVIGVQFHPERSSSYGAAIIERFVQQAAVAYAR